MCGVLLFVRASKGSKRGVTCHGVCWKDNPNASARLDLSGPAQPRIEFVGAIARLLLLEAWLALPLVHTAQYRWPNRTGYDRER